jgi:hypothetical protein
MCTGAPAPPPRRRARLARTDPKPWQPQDLATSSAFARLILTTLELAANRQEEWLTPDLQFAVQHDAAWSRPVASSWNGSGSMRRRPRCSSSRPRSSVGPCGSSPSASSPMSDADPLPAWPLPRGRVRRARPAKRRCAQQPSRRPAGRENFATGCWPSSTLRGVGGWSATVHPPPLLVGWPSREAVSQAAGARQQRAPASASLHLSAT